MKNKYKFIKTKLVQSFDFGDLEGTKKSKCLDKKIHNIMLYYPDKIIGTSGESFNQVVDRSIGFINNVLIRPGNTLVVSHNSILCLIDLWCKNGRNMDFCYSLKFRKQYTNNKIKKITGSYNDTLNNVYSTKNGKLTEKGVLEAKKVAKLLRNKAITEVFASSLDRTVKTAKIILEEINKNKK